MKNFTLRAALGFIVRLLIVVPFALLMVNMGDYTTINNNISVFILIILGAATLLYLGIMVCVPAEYAIKTSIGIIEFHMFLPQVIGILLSATIILGLAFIMASVAFYWSAGILLLYAFSLYMWPKYIKRIDSASKDHMLDSLRS